MIVQNSFNFLKKITLTTPEATTLESSKNVLAIRESSTSLTTESLKSGTPYLPTHIVEKEEISVFKNKIGVYFQQSGSQKRAKLPSHLYMLGKLC